MHRRRNSRHARPGVRGMRQRARVGGDALGGGRDAAFSRSAASGRLDGPHPQAHRVPTRKNPCDLRSPGTERPDRRPNFETAIDERSLPGMPVQCPPSFYNVRVAETQSTKFDAEERPASPPGPTTSHRPAPTYRPPQTLRTSTASLQQITSEAAHATLENRPLVLPNCFPVLILWNFVGDNVLKISLFISRLVGAGARIRTADLLITNHGERHGARAPR